MFEYHRGLSHAQMWQRECLYEFRTKLSIHSHYTVVAMPQLSYRQILVTEGIRRQRFELAI